MIPKPLIRLMVTYDIMQGDNNDDSIRCKKKAAMTPHGAKRLCISTHAEQCNTLMLMKMPEKRRYDAGSKRGK